MAGNKAVSDTANERESYSTDCTDNGYSVSCSSRKQGPTYSSNKGKMVLGILLKGLSEDSNHSNAAKKELKLCMSENGWKKN